ncbi:MAG TPA: TRAP transporter small permease [Terrimesophilobacter sp.]|nr:TRAP transporter small permease [Terrimesophilobacter sp.]
MYGPLGLTRALNWLGRASSALAGIVIGALMLLTVADVIMRTMAGRGLPGALEIAEVTLAAAVYLGMLGAETTRLHIRTPILVDAIKEPASTVLRLIGMVVATAFTVWLAVSSFNSAARSISTGEYHFGIIQVPIWPSRLIVAICIAALALAIFGKVVEYIVRLRRKDTSPIEQGDMGAAY